MRKKLKKRTAANKARDALDKGVAAQIEPTHSEDGVDLTLIRWMLSLTPAERLQVLQDNLASILRLRGAKTET